MKKLQILFFTILLFEMFSITGTINAAHDFWVDDDKYLGSDITIDCQCRTVNTGQLDTTVLPDYSQEPNSQGVAWGLFSEDYELDFLNDFVGYRTKTYNCHSYIYYDSSAWVSYVANWWVFQAGANKDGCWIHEDLAPAGSTLTIYSDGVHSCYITNEEGKCGKEFLCKNNSKVYGALFPDDRYAKL
ncbi:MAG: hypothetical protein ACYTEN_02830 [Planctomycetota bacterium]|jgi:hypothetical protein